MGLMDFAKDVGMKLFATDEQAAEKITAHLMENNPGIEDLSVKVTDGVANITCKATNRASAEKTILMIGNVRGVSQVNYDIQSIETAAAVEISEAVVTETPKEAASVPKQTADSSLDIESVYYEIKSGDTLSKVAAKFYGDASSYNLIFEANKEVIGHPDKIYPGQRIRIPQ